MPELYQITKGKITAGIVVENNIVVKCAPIIKWAKGVNFNHVYKWLKNNHFNIEKVMG